MNNEVSQAISSAQNAPKSLQLQLLGPVFYTIY